MNAGNDPIERLRRASIFEVRGALPLELPGVFSAR